MASIGVRGGGGGCCRINSINNTYSSHVSKEETAMHQTSIFVDTGTILCRHKNTLDLRVS